MTSFRKWLLLLPWVRRQREEELRAEWDAHVAMAEEDARAAGAADGEAAARRDFGNRLRAAEETRAEWFSPKLDALGQDLRYAIRTLLRTPLFTSVAVLSLSLGIGAATVVFSLLESVVLKPLSYAEPRQLVFVREFVPALAHVYETLPVNIQQFFYWRDHAKAFQGMAAFRGSEPTLTGVGEPVRLDGVDTTADLFRVLNVTMARGRGFEPGEDRPGANRVAVITDSLWQRKFGRSEGILGRTITLEGKPVTVVGILPGSFRFPKGSDLGAWEGPGKNPEIFEPLGEVLQGWDGDYDYACVARLKPGRAMNAALSELKVLTAQMNLTYQIESKPEPRGELLNNVIGGTVKTALWVLFSAVLALVAIVCVNLTNLLLARAKTRTREFSIRTAIGAGQARLAQQILTEMALVSAVGGSLGALLAAAAVAALKRLTAVDLPRLNELEIDFTVALFAILLTGVCACLCGLLPALRVGKADPQAALRAGSHTATAQKESLRTRQALVGIEVALSMVLLFLAGLLISSLLRLMNTDKGFRAESALAVDLSLPDAGYAHQAERSKFFDRLLLEVRQLPGVRSAGLVQGLPLTGETQVNGIELPGAASGSWMEAGAKTPVVINVRFISPGYLETLAIPLVRGRMLEDADRSRHVSVISERLAAKVWPGRDPMGQHFRTGSTVGEVEVVGITRDTYNGRLEDGPTLIAYVPYWIRGPHSASVVIRTAAEPAAFMSEVRSKIWQLDASLAIPGVQTLGEVVDHALAARQFQMRIAAGFGAAALVLALIGIYGVVAYSVAQRRMELALRFTLGATRSGILGLVVKSGLRPVLFGLLAGVLLCAATGQLVRSLLFGVAPLDAATMAGTVGLLFLTAGIACVVPAIAAVRIDPGKALRYE